MDKKVSVVSAPLSIWLRPDERKALEAAAAQDARSLSALARLAILAWLNQHTVAVAPKAVPQGDAATLGIES